MNGTKIDRARRNALKAGGLLVGAFLVTCGVHKGASAAPGGDGNGNGNGRINGNGGNSDGKPGVGNAGRHCFARGTQILTREGYRPIETLGRGDEVAASFAGYARIKTMVSHTLSGVAGNWDGSRGNPPVLVRRGAFAENMPTADLCLTAWHPVYVEGVLVPVGDLVNGTSIVFKAAEGNESIDFFNIELERHDILDAQGALCESLQAAGTERCAPYLRLKGRRDRFQSHVRSAASLVIDRRQPIDVIRDGLEERGVALSRAA
jgi:hypothetical protein